MWKRALLLKYSPEADVKTHQAPGSCLGMQNTTYVFLIWDLWGHVQACFIFKLFLEQNYRLF